MPYGPQRLAPAGPPYDVIVGSDLIYYTYTPETPHSELLLWTLRRLAGPHTTVFLSLSLHHNPEEVGQRGLLRGDGDGGERIKSLCHARRTCGPTRPQSSQSTFSLRYREADQLTLPYLP